MDHSHNRAFGILRLTAAPTVRFLLLLTVLLVAACEPNGAQSFERGLQALEHGDYAEAYCLWRPLAERGDAEAQYYVGWLYANGYGLRVDPLAAADWWQRAAASGHAEAQFALGHVYSTGEGVAKDDALAVHWYRAAADQGHDEAQHILRSRLMENSDAARAALPDLLQAAWLGETRSIAGDRTNAREGPGKQHQVLMELAAGTAVLELGRNGDWVLVALPDSQRLVWVYAGLLE